MSQAPLTTRFVVGVDFEQTGDDALVTALRLARRLPGCEIHPVHVLVSPPGKNALDALDVAIGRALDELHQRMRFAAEELFGMEEWEQSTVVHARLGDPADAIHQVAIDMDADLILVGHRHRGMAERLGLGSVAAKLVRDAKVPVMIARPKQLEGLAKTDWLEPPREGETLKSERGWSRSELVVFGRRPSNISGLL